MNTLLQVLPNAPSAVCGIGDYGWKLAQALRDNLQVESRFLAAGTSSAPIVSNGEFHVDRLSPLEGDVLKRYVLDAFDQRMADGVLLHLSLYGYQKRGVPFWLASAVKQVTALGQNSRPKLMVMFHELAATSGIWNSAFWLEPFQKRILALVARSADLIRTNRECYAEALVKWSGLASDEVPVMPVFSNFGELKALPEWSTRKAQMVMFFSGIHAGGELDGYLKKAVLLGRSLGIEEIHMIGKGASTMAVPSGVKVVPHNFIEAHELSELLSRCQVAFSGYPVEYLAKSGIFAAYAAHGVPVVTMTEGVAMDQLKFGVHLLPVDECLENSQLALKRLPDVSYRLFEWYGGHSVDQTALSYHQQFLLA